MQDFVLTNREGTRMSGLGVLDCVSYSRPFAVSRVPHYAFTHQIITFTSSFELPCSIFDHSWASGCCCHNGILEAVSKPLLHDIW